MIRLSDDQCLLNDQSKAACNVANVLETEVWEFLPKKGYLHDAIKLTISLAEKSDVVKINYAENNVNALLI